MKKTNISTTGTSGQDGIHNQSVAGSTAGLGPVSQEDLKWLYQVTEAEAGGESYKGKTAVAASILNRVKSPDWPMTIQDTIFQVTKYNGISYYQYSPVLDKRIYEVTPSAERKKAVQAALNGEDPSKGAVVFYNPGKTDNQWVRSKEVTVIIGNHVFAK
ncbi:cell wall hydrolase [Paenibacillus alkaliterrae]|uniref:cell wall hydrolase n=1 Tax=Paenibacillus alkaliterrae TaxID=320909 RepID=UPI001F1E8ACF|nr:cell wall hydrolase [Paenibacillus alkaliterrae]MCF2939501.1 cell wall hydrolase [Paenibacillus alkaliterrae]